MCCCGAGRLLAGLLACAVSASRAGRDAALPHRASPISTRRRASRSRGSGSPAPTCGAASNSRRARCRSTCSTSTTPATPRAPSPMPMRRSPRKVDLLIEYNADADANAEIARRLPPPASRRWRLSTRCPARRSTDPTTAPPAASPAARSATFAQETWPDEQVLGVLIGDLADPGAAVTERVQGITEGVREIAAHADVRAARHRRTAGARRCAADEVPAARSAASGC